MQWHPCQERWDLVRRLRSWHWWYQSGCLSIWQWRGQSRVCLRFLSWATCYQPWQFAWQQEPWNPATSRRAGKKLRWWVVETVEYEQAWTQIRRHRIFVQPVTMEYIRKCRENLRGFVFGTWRFEVEKSVIQWRNTAQIIALCFKRSPNAVLPEQKPSKTKKRQNLPIDSELIMLASVSAASEVAKNNTFFSCMEVPYIWIHKLNCDARYNVYVTIHSFYEAKQIRVTDKELPRETTQTNYYYITKSLTPISSSISYMSSTISSESSVSYKSGNNARDDSL